MNVTTFCDFSGTVIVAADLQHSVSLEEFQRAINRALYEFGCEMGAHARPVILAAPSAVAEPEKLLTKEEVMLKAVVKLRTFRRDRRKGLITPVWIGKHGKHFYSSAGTDDYIRELREKKKIK
jgi:hypothetical protein